MKRQAVYQWIQSGLIRPDRINDALKRSGEMASTSQWAVFLKQFLMMAGLLSMAIGVIFFFAFNWDDMTGQSKFILVQAAMALVMVVYFLKPWGEWMRLTWFLTLALLIGAFLALFGQTYQTGADPWQLFAVWTVLITPLALVGRFEVFWVFWVVLANTALGLFLFTHQSLFSLMLNSHHMMWLMVFCNLMLWVGLVGLSNSEWIPSWLRLRRDWASQVMVLVLLCFATFLGFLGVVEGHKHSTLSVLYYAAIMAGLYAYYRHKKIDLLVLAAWCLSLILVILAAVAEPLFTAFEAGGLLLLAMMLIVLTTTAVKRLKSIHQGVVEGDAQ